MKLPIYLDHHATTPLDPRVLEAMRPYLEETFGNAASRTHSFGWDAERAVEESRAGMAKDLGAKPREIIFTSGATEANNLAILGAARGYRKKGRHIVAVVTEHKAVLDPCKYLEEDGCEVTRVPVGPDGLVNPDEIAAVLRDDTILLSVMLANNEIGVIQPLRQIRILAREREVLLHTDGAQAVGKIPVDLGDADLLSLSAHKFYGPKGIGALWIRSKDPRVRLAPVFFGGGHERGLRSGTLNVPGIVGMAKALALAVGEMEEEQERVLGLRKRLQQGILGSLEGVTLNGHPESRLAGNLNLSFQGVPGESLVNELREIAVSFGSACTSADPEPSHVLRSLGVGDSLAHSSIRFGIGRFNTEEEIDYTIKRVVEAVTHLREIYPMEEMAEGL